MDNNQRLKAISTALRLSRNDIVAACKEGGCDASHTQVRLWLAGAGKNIVEFIGRTPSGQTDYSPMTDFAFDAFCLGLYGLYRDSDPEC